MAREILCTITSCLKGTSLVKELFDHLFLQNCYFSLAFSLQQSGSANNVGIGSLPTLYTDEPLIPLDQLKLMVNAKMLKRELTPFVASCPKWVPYSRMPLTLLMKSQYW